MRDQNLTSDVPGIRSLGMYVLKPSLSARWHGGVGERWVRNYFGEKSNDMCGMFVEQ